MLKSVLFLLWIRADVEQLAIWWSTKTVHRPTAQHYTVPGRRFTSLPTCWRRRRWRLDDMRWTCEHWRTKWCALELPLVNRRPCSIKEFQVPWAAVWTLAFS